MNTIFSHRFDINRGTFARDILAVFAATPKLFPEELASLLEKEIEQNLAPDEVVIIVREPAFANTETELQRISQKAKTLIKLHIK